MRATNVDVLAVFLTAAAGAIGKVRRTAAAIPPSSTRSASGGRGTTSCTFGGAEFGSRTTTRHVTAAFVATLFLHCFFLVQPSFVRLHRAAAALLRLADPTTVVAIVAAAASSARRRDCPPDDWMNRRASWSKRCSSTPSLLTVPLGGGTIWPRPLNPLHSLETSSGRLWFPGAARPSPLTLLSAGGGGIGDSGNRADRGEVRRPAIDALSGGRYDPGARILCVSRREGARPKVGRLLVPLG